MSISRINSSTGFYGRVLGWVACSLGVSSLGSIAAAQDPISPWLRYNVGKVVILPSAGVANMYTDNLFSLPSPLRVSDVITTVTPGLRLKLDENALVDASVSYKRGETFIWDHTDFNSNSDTVDAKVAYSTAKLKLQGAANYTDSLSLANGAVNLGRTLLQSTRRSGNVQATYDWTPKTDFTASAGYANNTFGNANLSNQEQIDGSLGTSYEMTSKYRLTFTGRGGHTQAQSAFLASQGSVDSYFWGGLVGVRGTFTPKLSGAAQVGYEGRQYDGGVSYSANTPAFRVSLTYQWSLMTTATLAYDRSTALAPWSEGQVTILDVVQATVTQKIGTSGRWTASASAQFSNGDYIWDMSNRPVGSVDLGRSDQRMGFQLALQYTPTAWFSCVASYALDNFEMNFDDPRSAASILARSYLANRVTLSANVGF